MCRIGSLVTEAERKHVRRRAQFQHQDARCHQVFIFPARQGSEEIHAILTDTLGKHAPRMPPSKTGCPSLNVVNFSICDKPRPGRPKTLTTPEIIDQIREIILEDRRPNFG
jgi:hypothetical protein